MLLYGGNSSERAVSLQSGLRVIEAFAETEHTVTAHDWRGGVPDKGLLRLAQESDAVFLSLHGGDGEGGMLQTALESAGVFHYTGSDSKGAARALDKAIAKRYVAAAGVPVARGDVWQVGQAAPDVPYPAIAKPLFGGSSVGLTRIEAKTDLASLTCDEPLLVEEYLAGREFTVGILGNNALPAVEIIPGGGIYDYHHKYTEGATRELCPAPITKEKADRLCTLALRAFKALDLRDYARIDFKENAAGHPCFLEANTLPGLTVTSLLPLAAKAVGISFPALCEYMAACAAKRKRKPYGAYS